MRSRKRYDNQRNVQTNLSRRLEVRFLGDVPQTRSNHWEHMKEDKRAGGKTTRHGRSSHHHCSSLHFLSSSPADAEYYTVPPPVGNLDRRSLTHSCRPQATARKRSRYQPNRSGSPQPRGEHSSLVSKTIQARRNASVGEGPD